jgi:hypothetical protein
MIKAIQILEEYEKMCKSFQMSGKPARYTIFKNPTLKEIREAEDEGGAAASGGGEVRFIADNATKDIYVFSAFLANHNDARTCLGLKCISDVENKYVCGSQLDGTAERIGTKLIMNESDMIGAEKKFRDAIFAQDWSWVERYVNISDYFEILKKRFRWKDKNDKSI